jgi:AcrR family transcriptional regulator
MNAGSPRARRQPAGAATKRPSGRSAAAPRLTPSERLMDTAAALFNAHGIRATGIDSILAKAGVARMTLYRNYGNKDGLVRSVLQRESAAWLEWLDRELGCMQGTAHDRLCAYFDLLERWFAQPDFRGCSFINSVAEAPLEGDCVKPIAAAHRQASVAFLVRLLADAGVPDLADFAEQIVMLADGATVGAMITGDIGLLRRARAAALALMRDAAIDASRAA